MRKETSLNSEEICFNGDQFRDYFKQNNLKIEDYDKRSSSERSMYRCNSEDCNFIVYIKKQQDQYRVVEAGKHTCEYKKKLRSSTPNFAKQQNSPSIRKSKSPTPRKSQSLTNASQSGTPSKLSKKPNAQILGKRPPKSPNAKKAQRKQTKAKAKRENKQKEQKAKPTPRKYQKRNAKAKAQVQKIEQEKSPIDLDLFVDNQNEMVHHSNEAFYKSQQEMGIQFNSLQCRYESICSIFKQIKRLKGDQSSDFVSSYQKLQMEASEGMHSLSNVMLEMIKTGNNRIFEINLKKENA